MVSGFSSDDIHLVPTSATAVAISDTVARQATLSGIYADSASALTVAIDQTLESAATLGLIVLVRTFLSFSLDIEMDGVVPWRRRASERTPGS